MTIDVSEVDVLLVIIDKSIKEKGGRGKLMSLGMFRDLINEANAVHAKLQSAAVENVINQQIKDELSTRSNVIKS